MLKCQALFCPCGVVILIGIIRKRLACGKKVNEWPLSQHVLTPPFSTWFLGTSQLLQSTRKAVRSESCPAASPILSCSLCLLFSFLPIQAFSLNDLKFKRLCFRLCQTQGFTRKVAGSRDGGSLERQVSQPCLNQSRSLYFI